MKSYLFANSGTCKLKVRNINPVNTVELNIAGQPHKLKAQETAEYGPFPYGQYPAELSLETDGFLHYDTFEPPVEPAVEGPVEKLPVDDPDAIVPTVPPRARRGARRG